MLSLTLLGALVLAASGIPGLAGISRRRAALASTALQVTGALLGLVAALDTLLRARVEELHRPWGLPGGALAIRLDPLAAAFLTPLFLVAGLAAVYGLGYVRDQDRPEVGHRLRLFSGVLAGSMAVVFLARNGMLFLVAWELMALAAFFLVIADDRDPAARKAGWVYLVATHAGTLCLIVAFTILAPGGGALAASTRPWTAPSLAVLLFAVLGFGLKAGLVPLHFWLPAAHATAPSHVSAMLSGVMLKTGLYGVLRIATLLPDPPVVVPYGVVALGAVGAVTGIFLALAQRDLKRALAYSSVENVGIVMLGVGLALLGRTRGVVAWQVSGISAATLHVWSHSLFKPLLFFGAGAVQHATGGRDLERLGGLGARMPRTASLLLVGAVTAAALPPSAAFASEWLLYAGFLDVLASGASDPAVALAVPALALSGALAVACFVRLHGTMFLGAPRSDAPGRARDPGASMWGPMAILAALSMAIGLAPSLATIPLGNVCREWTGNPSAPPLGAPLAWLSVAGPGVAVVGAVAWAALRHGPAARRRASVTWDCGYAAPSSRMQYTARSFGEWWTERLAPAFMRPRVRLPRLRAPFPDAAALEVETPEPFGEGLYEPLLLRWSERFAALRQLQQGRSAAYLLYVLVTLVLLLAWSALAGHR